MTTQHKHKSSLVDTPMEAWYWRHWLKLGHFVRYWWWAMLIAAIGGVGYLLWSRFMT